MANLRDILSDENHQLNEEELMNYIHDNLSEEDKHAVEKKISASGFVIDAVEGLKAFENKQQLNDYVKQLNKNLEKQLTTKKLHNEKRKIKELPIMLVSALIILILCVVCYIAIHLYHRSSSILPLQNKHQQSLQQ
jgi:hypothetical protein